jgi:hypothetical protein
MDPTRTWHTLAPRLGLWMTVTVVTWATAWIALVPTWISGVTFWWGSAVVIGLYTVVARKGRP